MANPQQPELRRSEQIPALSPDATEAEVAADRDRRSRPLDRTEEEFLSGQPESGDEGAQDQDQEQDQPDLDRFARRFGTVEDETASDS